jgi:prevent-host-death family protein
MQTISSNSAKQSLGQVLETAQHEPVLIHKHKHPTAVILSVAEYDRLKSGEASTRKSAPFPVEPSIARESKILTNKSLPVVGKLPQRRRKHYTSMEMMKLVKSAELDQSDE